MHVLILTSEICETTVPMLAETSADPINLEDIFGDDGRALLRECNLLTLAYFIHLLSALKYQT